MVCILCYDYLFGSLVTDIPGTNTTRRVGALSCGHTFHLECIASWLEDVLNTRCPVCSVNHNGTILPLRIECDLDHVANDKQVIGDKLKTAELLCNSSLDSAEQQEALYRDLETKAADLQIKLDEKRVPLKRMQATLTELSKKIKSLENQEKELSALSARHKANIQGLQSALELKDKTIARLKQKISEQSTELA
ncbi:hypothetical protein FBU31_000532 [Coemansia sp. 'formosensis']|nr:hypothetical protein FBU31_000532 [Coemansia sp. 'formosensis']